MIRLAMRLMPYADDAATPLRHYADVDAGDAILMPAGQRHTPPPCHMLPCRYIITLRLYGMPLTLPVLRLHYHYDYATSFATMLLSCWLLPRCADAMIDFTADDADTLRFTLIDD